MSIVVSHADSVTLEHFVISERGSVDPCEVAVAIFVLASTELRLDNADPRLFPSKD